MARPLGPLEKEGSVAAQPWEVQPEPLLNAALQDSQIWGKKGGEQGTLSACGVPSDLVCVGWKLLEKPALVPVVATKFGCCGG